MSDKQSNRVFASRLLGWAAVILVTSAAGFWSFWGIIEGFHEGWCKPGFWGRSLQLVAYLTPAISLTCLAAIGVKWPRSGAIALFVTGAGIAFAIVISQSNFSGFVVFTIVAVPLLTGVAFWFGRPKPERLAIWIATGIPLLVLLIAGVEPVLRVSNRFDDGNRSSRVIQGNAVALRWAPAGPGWTRDGNVSWDEAIQRAIHLSADGLTLMENPQHLWRLPTRKEIVHSLTRNNENAGGVWAPEKQRPHYEIRPDKESPVWDRYASLIYLWTSEERDDETAWIVVYHGGVFAKPKSLGSSSAGFRAVR